MKNTVKNSVGEKDQKNSIIKNLGTIILCIMALVLGMIITSILIKYSRNPLIIKITDTLKSKLFYNSILRTGV